MTSGTLPGLEPDAPALQTPFLRKIQQLCPEARRNDLTATELAGIAMGFIERALGPPPSKSSS